ncbi:TD and POZ domain-containing protein 5 [Araneus ventricosus]|uniref:TD and POZ domain-containing protein 5 n=1 Tax=Araneus ventricosus TaxID=182803 RepID=A0A4Y2WCT6_ARAVE|nr:TD and POZ domain-containing protein 5 [Araneus ventricosus]GBO34454.1 TD and POZ domain-containing protein 5 [Araneus ventricosus]
MAAKIEGGTNGYTFLWKIENISHCWWVKKTLTLVSPAFTADALECTKWKLEFKPIGAEDENFIGFFLFREIECSGPDIIDVNFQFAILDKDGSIVAEKTARKFSFITGQIWGFPKYETRQKVFVTERDTFLPEDTLTVQCTIWNKQAKPVYPKLISARTVYKVKRGSFLWRIDKFSTVKSGLSNKCKHNLIDFDLVLNEGPAFTKRFVLNINSFIETIKYFSFKISIVDSLGNKETCGIQKYFVDDFEEEKLTAVLFTKRFMENKRRYLPNDVLSLDCEYVISTKINFYEFFRSERIFSKFTNEAVVSRNEHEKGKEKSLSTALLANDLKFMYNDAIFSDTEIRTSTRNFPVHKGILSARSPVFRRMFSHDMKEKNSGHVEITDFEDDTIHRMLLYMYTDSLEDLQFQSASKLYTLADKYQIMSLKSKCSSFLKENLCPRNVCDVLVLADLHNDDGLKGTVQDYILGEHKEIFCSQEWKDFMNTHLKLAADVMHKKIFQA